MIWALVAVWLFCVLCLGVMAGWALARRVTRKGPPAWAPPGPSRSAARARREHKRSGRMV